MAKSSAVSAAHFYRHCQQPSAANKILAKRACSTRLTNKWAEIGGVFRAFAELDQHNAQLRRSVAQHEQEQARLQRELANRDEALMRYEFASDDTTNALLDHYREAVAALQRGEDASEALGAIDQREKVWLLAPARHDQAVQACDLIGEQLVRILTECRQVSPLTEDPDACDRGC